jgi:hypothetical protein
LVVVKTIAKFVNKILCASNLSCFFAALDRFGLRLRWSPGHGSDNVGAREMAKKLVAIDSLGQVLEQSLKRLDLYTRLNDYAVWPIWNDVVGHVIARNAQPEKIRNGTLIVKVSSPVWMQQLQFMKEMIAAKLNHRLKAETVKNIFFTVGRVEVSDDAPAPPPLPARSFPEVDEAFIETIDDPEIRAAFKKLWKSYCARQSKP